MRRSATLALLCLAVVASPVSASVLKMSEAQACEHAQAIVLMFSSLHEAPPVVVASRPATLLRAVPDEPEIPAFLNRA